MKLETLLHKRRMFRSLTADSMGAGVGSGASVCGGGAAGGAGHHERAGLVALHPTRPHRLPGLGSLLLLFLHALLGVLGAVPVAITALIALLFCAILRRVLFFLSFEGEMNSARLAFICHGTSMIRHLLLHGFNFRSFCTFTGHIYRVMPLKTVYSMSR